jgi:hypothetical protein
MRCDEREQLAGAAAQIRKDHLGRDERGDGRGEEAPSEELIAQRIPRAPHALEEA